MLWSGKLRFLLLLALLVPCIALAARPVFDFNENCKEAYHEIIQLRVDDARQLIEQEKKINPENLTPYFLENYIGTFKLLFNGDRSDYEKYLNLSDKRLSRIKKGSSDSPYYLFFQSVMNLQTAACKFKFGDKVSSFWYIRRAYLQIIENKSKYPHFGPNKIIMGPMQALIGSIPSNYRWAIRLLGFKEGSIARGLKLMHAFLTEDQGEENFFKQEAVFYYVYMVFYLKHQPDSAIAIIKRRGLDLKNNALYAFMAANLYMNDHAAAEAMKILKERQHSSAYLDIPVMHYELATAYLYHLELDNALKEYKNFLKDYKGGLYAKDALFKISWIYFLKGNKAESIKYRDLVLSKGSSVTDADKVAVRTVKNNQWPDKTILKARLLFSGGYFEEALHQLLSRSVEDYKSLVDKVEYTYFLARIRDEMGMDDQALLLYKATIEGGQSLPEYFAARAALQTGFIYEKRGEVQKAITYFQKCLDMPNKEYKESLDQRAKSGINRLKTK